MDRPAAVEKRQDRHHGGSYVGFTQLSQAIKGSQYLTAIVPNVTTLDTYGNWIYAGGAFQEFLSIGV